MSLLVMIGLSFILLTLVTTSIAQLRFRGETPSLIDLGYLIFGATALGTLLALFLVRRSSP